MFTNYKYYILAIKWNMWRMRVWLYTVFIESIKENICESNQSIFVIQVNLINMKLMNRARSEHPQAYISSQSASTAIANHPVRHDGHDWERHSLGQMDLSLRLLRVLKGHIHRWDEGRLAQHNTWCIKIWTNFNWQLKLHNQ